MLRWSYSNKAASIPNWQICVFSAQQDLILPALQAYFDALTSQDNVALYKNKKNLIKQQLEAAQAKFDAGLATIVDVNTAQAAIDLANPQEIAA